MIALLSPTSVLLDGSPLGSPQQAIAARPDLAFAIASAMLVYDREQRAADNVEALTVLTAARTTALAAAATSAALVETLTAEKESLEAQVFALQNP